MRLFILLIRIRLLSLWNVALHTTKRHPFLSAGLTVLGIGVFAGVYYGFRLFLDLVHAPLAREEMIYEIFYFLFLFLLAGAVPFVASTLLHSNDYLLLGTSPASPRAVVAVKLLDATVTNSLQFTVIGIPAIAACGAALGLTWTGWLLLVPLIALFVLLPALLTSLFLLFSLALFGMKRVRRAITAVNAVMATTVCLTIVLQANRLPLRDGFTLFAPMMADSGSSARVGPSGWFAGLLLSLAQGDFAMGAIDLLRQGVFVALLYGISMTLGGRLLTASAVAEEGEGETPAAVVVGEIRPSRQGFLTLFSSPVAALIAKDLKYILRDTVLLSQLAMPVILFFVPFVLAMQESFHALATPTELFPFAAAMTGIIVFMQTSIISLSSVGLESRSFWLVLSSPNGGRTLLWAKFAMSTLVSAGVGVFLSVIAAIVFRASPVVVLVQCALVVLSATAMCGMGVGISAALPRFVYDNPAHRVSAWALILGFLATVLYTGLAGGILTAAYLFAMQSGEYAVMVYSVGGGLFLVLTLAAAIIPMSVGARRIEVYQWEH